MNESPNESQNERGIQLLYEWAEMGATDSNEWVSLCETSEWLSSKESHLRFPATPQIAKQIRAAVGRLFNDSKQHLSAVVKVISASAPSAAEKVWN